MNGLVFERPELLWAAGPVLAVLLLWHLRPRRRYLAWSTASLLAALSPRPSILRRAPAVALVAGLAALVLALMRPVRPYVESQVAAEGLDIVLVLDLSSSMQEIMNLQRPTMSMQSLTFSSQDNAPRKLEGKTRLTVTKEAMKDLISRRRDDRLGLVVFSDHAYLVSPLTFDHDNLFKYVDMIDDQILRGEGMTAIGDGVTLATQLLARQSPETTGNKLIVVFTDGENNMGRDPVEALQEADRAGIRSHVIGVDLEDEVKTRPAVLALIQAVRRLGGQYFNADTQGELREAYRRIDTIERGRLTRTEVARRDPAYAWFVERAVGLLCAAMLLRALPAFRDLT